VATGETLGGHPIGRITEDDLDRAAIIQGSEHQQPLPAKTIKSLEKWGRRKGYLSRRWLSEFTSLMCEKYARRDRRLVPDEPAQDGKVKAEGEERRLLAAANPWLQRLIIGALETGCRRGELLSFQWQDVSLTRNELTIRAEKKAWTATCLRAEITDLHFHDLRDEAGSPMMEAGWPIHHVQQMLGHADLKHTSTYLNVTRSGLQESMKRFGTAPLHVVANQTNQEPAPSCNDVSASEKQVTVNEMVCGLASPARFELAAPRLGGECSIP
jgi:integrase